MIPCEHEWLFAKAELFQYAGSPITTYFTFVCAKCAELKQTSVAGKWEGEAALVYAKAYLNKIHDYEINKTEYCRKKIEEQEIKKQQEELKKQQERKDWKFFWELSKKIDYKSIYDHDFCFSDSFGCTVRTYHYLAYNNIFFVGDLISKSEKDLMAIKNLGKKSINEIKNVLERNNLSLNSKPPADWRRLDPESYFTLMVITKKGGNPKPFSEI
jgi:hypothetical protein